MATRKFNVGDRVIVEESNIEGTCGVNLRGKDVVGTIESVSYNPNSNHPYWVVMDEHPHGLYCKVKCLASESEKIVITHNGKVTTATLYGEFGSKVTATARCAPEDEFDFNVGANLAMERPMEKVTHVTRGGFKVGDRVNYEGHNGVVICIQSSTTTETPIGVEFDDWWGARHNCDGLLLADGKRGTTRRCKWCEPELLKHGEVESKPVELWNGRVVCTQKGKCVGFTQGKIYKVENGKLIDDQGEKRPMLTKYYISKPEDLTETTGYFAKWDDKFIPIVE